MQSLVHLVSGEQDERETALAIAENLLADESGAIDEVAVVARSKGIDAVTTEGDAADKVATLRDDGVAFSARANTMEMLGLLESDLVEGVETVPEGPSRWRGSRRRGTPPCGPGRHRSEKPFVACAPRPRPGAGPGRYST
jgi:intracellular sulfur oxidation DsrE/DsrF family protein